MASRFLTRSKALALAVPRADTAAPAPPLYGARWIRALLPPPRSGRPVAAILGYEQASRLSGTQVLPRWFSTGAFNGSSVQQVQTSQTSPKTIAGMVQSDALKTPERASAKVTAFSPLEATIAKHRSSPLASESLKVRQSELLTSYILHDSNSASCIKEQHQYFSSSLVSIPSSLHVPQGDLSGLCPPRHHQKVGFDILQAALANHGQGHNGLL